MKDNRRAFIKKAALGSVAISATGGVSSLSTNVNPESARVETIPSEWIISFEEATSGLSLANGPVSIIGKLTFTSGNSLWNISKSRDGIPGRYSIIDLQGNVQGYFVINKSSGQLKLIFYHRTAQSYPGVFTYAGNINFSPDSFACRTIAGKDERVLSLSNGRADSLLNDSLFSPLTDTVLKLNSGKTRIISEGDGLYSFSISGRIQESSESVFSIELETDYFRKSYIPYYHPLNRDRCPKAPSGWMSWNTYFDKATAGDNLSEALTGQKYLLPFGCEFWSIESWQGNSDKLPVRDFYNMNLEVSERKFPDGMKKLADEIRKLGFRPGLWTAPFGTGNEEFYKGHKGWFLHDKEGKPLSCWNGRYTLDPTVPEAIEHLKEIHRIASREWGYEFFKIDGMSGRSHSYCAHLYERPEVKACFRDPSCANPFELCVKAFREGMGEDRVFLACQGHTSGPEVKYADASRIGADIVHPNMAVQWTGVLGQGRCFLNQAFTHNIVTVADPDTLLVNDLPLEEARVSATVVALPGQLTFFADKLKDLPEDRMKILQQTLPPADVHPVSLYPYFSMLPVWNLNIKNQLLGNYNVVALFNWNDVPETISFTTEEIGLEPAGEYLLFEFWTQKSHGIIKEKYSSAVPSHGVRLFAMHRLEKIPQWISSDRHIAQNAMELKDFRWNNNIPGHEGKINLIGTFPLTMFVRVPSEYSFRKVKCKGVSCTAKKTENDVLSITFTAGKTGDYDFIIEY